MKIIAIVTCFNRVASTQRCLESLFACAGGHEVSAIVMDDGSTDGTADVLARTFPRARVLTGTGNLYWCGGMARAEAEALREQADAVLWLNDDVVLDVDAIDRLVTESATREPRSIVVGAVRSAVDESKTIYGGLKTVAGRPLSFAPAYPSAHTIRVDTFNGNVVLVPLGVARELGGIDGQFGHAFADLDYGLRGAKCGVLSYQLAGTVGTCSEHEGVHPALDSKLSFMVRWKALTGVKGQPPRPRARFLRRHGGRMWIIYWPSAYLRLIASSLRGR